MTKINVKLEEDILMLGKNLKEEMEKMENQSEFKELEKASIDSLKDKDAIISKITKEMNDANNLNVSNKEEIELLNNKILEEQESINK